MVLDLTIYAYIAGVLLNHDSFQGPACSKVGLDASMFLLVEMVPQYINHTDESMTAEWLQRATTCRV